MRQKSLEKRLASEKRKEIRKLKSREAARCRRGKEVEVFADLTDSLPVPETNKSTLDKTSIIRLCINYMRAREFSINALSDKADCGAPSEDQNSSLDINELVANMNNIVMVITPASEIIYITENVKDELGLCQFDVIGNKLVDYIHPCDVSDVEAALKSKDKGISFTSRMKTTILPKGRVVNIKSASYKPLRFSGQRLFADIKLLDCKSSNQASEYLVVVGVPFVKSIDVEEHLDCMTFVSSHSLELKFTDCESEAASLCRYDSEALHGVSLYDIIHGSDVKAVEESFKALYTKGHTVTDSYRMLAYGGGYVRAITQASLIYNQKNSKPQSVVCVHHVIGSVEDSDSILAEIQIPRLDDKVRVKTQPALRAADEEASRADDIMALTASMFCSQLTYDERSTGSPADIYHTTAKMFMNEEDDIPSATEKLFSSGADVNDIISKTASMFSIRRSDYTDESEDNKPDLEQYVDKLESDFISLNSGLLIDTTDFDDVLDEEFFLRAPYIPMDMHDDVNLLDGLSLCSDDVADGSSRSSMLSYPMFNQRSCDLMTVSDTTMPPVSSSCGMDTYKIHKVPDDEVKGDKAIAVNFNINIMAPNNITHPPGIRNHGKASSGKGPLVRDKTAEQRNDRMYAVNPALVCKMQTGNDSLTAHYAVKRRYEDNHEDLMMSADDLTCNEACKGLKVKKRVYKGKLMESSLSEGDNKKMKDHFQLNATDWLQKSVTAPWQDLAEVGHSNDVDEKCTRHTHLKASSAQNHQSKDHLLNPVKYEMDYDDEGRFFFTSCVPPGERIKVKERKPDVIPLGRGNSNILIHLLGRK